jgi:hypothetical protein
MGHILDNLTGDSIFASIFGGEPSDDMARHLGVDPAQCTLRFRCSKYEKMLRDVESELPISVYASRGPSEDFAVTFEQLIINEAVTIEKTPIRSHS